MNISPYCVHEHHTLVICTCWHFFDESEGQKSECVVCNCLLWSSYRRGEREVGETGPVGPQGDEGDRVNAGAAARALQKTM